MIKNLSQINKYLKDPYSLLLRELCKHPRLFNDEQYIRIKYRFRMGKKLNLDNPTTYNEKLQWLKLYNHIPDYTIMVDKIAVKSFISNIIGGEYIVPTIATYRSVDQIRWDDLPNSFVIKCNHDSGGLIVCKNKKDLDIKVAVQKLKYSMAHDNYSITREWPYKNVQKALLCEEYLEDDTTGELRDYKFFCFNGVPKVMFIAQNRWNKNIETTFDFFDMEFNHLPFQWIHPNANTTITKPECFEEMIELASKLSKGLPHVRVDFYQVNGKVFFGEMTFFTCGGFAAFFPEQWDRIFGDWIELPKMKRV